ncbi:unnamed protein product, partial [Effrenium voratum]
ALLVCSTRAPDLAMAAMRRHCARLLLATAALALVCRQHDSETFVAGGISRRGMVAAMPTLLGAPGMAWGMTQGITDVVEYMNRRKRELIPYMKQGIDYLEAHEVDERMELFTPKMCRKMEAYAGLLSKGAAPDKTTYKLNASVRAFEKAIKAKDKKAALEAFQKYQDDVPDGIGRFDVHNPVTFEGPKVELPAAA